MNMKKRGSLMVRRRQGERVFFFAGKQLIGELVMKSHHGDFEVKFDKGINVRREEILTPEERKLASV